MNTQENKQETMVIDRIYKLGGCISGAIALPTASRFAIEMMATLSIITFSKSSMGITSHPYPPRRWPPKTFVFPSSI